MTRSPVQIVQAYLEAMNAGDPIAIAAEIAEGITVYGPDWSIDYQGRPAFGAHYCDLFASNPDLKAELLDRIAVGEWVIDEWIVGGYANGTQAHSVTIFQIVDGLIATVRTLTDQPRQIRAG
jgi:hypothetical protein